MMRLWRRLAAVILTVVLLMSNFISVYPDSLDGIVLDDWYEEEWFEEDFDEPLVGESDWEEWDEGDISFEDDTEWYDDAEDNYYNEVEDENADDTEENFEDEYEVPEYEADEQDDEEIADDAIEDADGQTEGTVDEEVTDSTLSIVEEVEEAVAEEQVNTQTEFTADADGVTVTATVERPEALPAGVEFRVTPVTQYTEGYNYEAYLNALNDNAEAIGRALDNEDIVEAASQQTADTPDEEKLYRTDNTLLYDIAFMADKKDDAGNVIEGQKVEVQPEQGSVQLHFDFHNGQLTNDLDAGNADAITVVHLPLADEVREAVDATSEAWNIDAGDIQVDVLTDSFVDSENGSTADFSLDSFSVAAIATYRKNNNGVQAWTGTTPTSAADIRNGLGTAGSFAVFANQLKLPQHIEGTFATHELLDVSSQFGNTNRTNIKASGCIVTVKKTVTGDQKSGTFRFGLYNGSGKVQEIEITTDENGQGEKSFSTAVSGSGTLTVYELDANGNPVTSGSFTKDGTTYTVTYDGSNSIQLSAASVSNISYAELLSGSGSNVFNQGYNPVLVVGKENNVDQTGGQNNYPLITRGYYRLDVGAGGTVIRETGNFPINFTDSFNRLNNLSKSLAMATDGDNVHVINVTASSSYSFWSDMAKAFGYSGEGSIYNAPGFQTIDSGEILLINIDCSNVTEYNLERFWVNGKISGFDKSNNDYPQEASDRIVFNFVKKSGNSYVPYTGKINASDASGTILAPSASVNFKNYAGAVIGNYVENSAEIHASPINGSETTEQEVKVVNTSTGTTPTPTVTPTPTPGTGNCTIKIWKTINATDSGWGFGNSNDPNQEIRNKLNNLYFVIEGPNGYRKEVYYKDFPDEVYGGKELVLSSLEPGTYTVTEYDGGLEGYKYWTVVRTMTNYNDNRFSDENNWTKVEDVTSISNSTSNGTTTKFWFNNHYDWNALNFKKVDPDGNELAGAALKLTRKNGQQWVNVDSWTTTSSGTHDVIVSNTGTYRLEETAAPNGYILADPVTFEVKSRTVSYTDYYYGQPYTAYRTEYYVEGGNTIVMTDKYSPTEAAIKAAKILENGTLTANQFSFELTPAQSTNPMPTTAEFRNDGDGDVTFGPITYTEAGTYTYTIRETVPSDPGLINYDTKTYTAIVEVKGISGEGLVAAVTYKDENGNVLEESSVPTFVNRQKASASLRANKIFENETLEGDEFQFKLTAINGAPMPTDATELTAANAADGDVNFGTILYSEERVFTYSIEEVIPDAEDSGIVYDTKKYEARVTVAKNSRGVLEAVVKYYLDGAEAEPTFTNKPKPTTAVLEAEKEFTNGSLKGDDFEFVLSPEGDAPMPDDASAKNDSDGKVAFGEITYTEKGTYHYTITEVIPRNEDGSQTDAGITYDAAQYRAAVTVSYEDGEGLKASVTYERISENGSMAEPVDIPKFVNIKNPVSTHLEAVKQLLGRELKDEEFQFVLAVDESVTQNPANPLKAPVTVSNDADGNVVFPDIEYTEQGAYHYTISEVVKDDDGTTIYDRTIYEATVNVTDEENVGLTAVVVYTKGESALEDGAVPEFVNKIPVEAAIEAGKTLLGQDLKKDAFSFELVPVKSTDEDDPENPLTETLTTANAEDGSISFDKITFVSAGNYFFKMREVIPEEASGEPRTFNGVIYDEKVYDVRVIVTDDAENGLTAKVVYLDGETELTGEPEFINKTPVTAEVRAKKIFEKGELHSGDFEFEITPKEKQTQSIALKDIPMPEGATPITDQDTGEVVSWRAAAKNDEEGNVVFGPMTYTRTGWYEYTIREIEPADDEKLQDVLYDEHVWNARVYIVEGENGELAALKVEYDYGDEDCEEVPVFTNTQLKFYDMELLKLNGNSEQPMEAGSVSFRLESLKSEITGERDDETNWEVVNDASGNSVAVIDADGKIEYTRLAPGTYRLIETDHPGDFGGFNQPIVFTVSEEGQFETEITNDTFFYFNSSSGGSGSGAVQKAILTVKNYKNINMPKSGGNSAMWCMVFGALIALFGVVLLVSGRGRKRRLI